MNKSNQDFDFWTKTEKALIQALCTYIVLYCPKEDQHLARVYSLLRTALEEEQMQKTTSTLDKIFDAIDPNSIAVKSYKSFVIGAGINKQEIILSCLVRLDDFSKQEQDFDKYIERLTKPRI